MRAQHRQRQAVIRHSMAHLVSVFRGESARLLELDLGNHAGLEVGDLHDACVLYVYFAHDQVVDGRCHLHTDRFRVPNNKKPKLDQLPKQTRTDVFNTIRQFMTPSCMRKAVWCSLQLLLANLPA